MTTTDSLRAQHLADQFGRRVALRLHAGTDELSYEARERLRAARVRALSVRKQPEVAPVVVGRGGSATRMPGFSWRAPRMASRWS